MSTHFLVVGVLVFGFAMFVAGTMISVWSTQDICGVLEKDIIVELRTIRDQMAKESKDASARDTRMIEELSTISADARLLLVRSNSRPIKLSKAQPNLVTKKTIANKSDYAWTRRPRKKRTIPVVEEK